MTTPPREPLFLARQTYRRRRLMDAARLLPFLGVVLFALPILWSGDADTRDAKIYVFIAWFFLIVLAAVLARRLSRQPSEDDEDGAQ